MGINKFFHNFSSKSPEAPSTSDGSESIDSLSQLSDWDSVAGLARTAGSTTTYDSLASVPFAADTPLNPNGGGSFNPDASEQLAIDSPELRAIKNFFQTDLRIKRELIDIAPSEIDNYNEDSRMDYVERAYRTFKDFRRDFQGINRDFGFGPYTSKQLDTFFKRGAEKFAIGRYDSNVTDNLYRHEFTDLRPDFVEEVKDQCVGYLVDRDFDALINHSQTINELLHVYHSYIMNNEHILQSIPELAKKTNTNGAEITLRGDPTELSQQIFDALPNELDIGDSDIIGAGEQTIMMVRDRGHALTLSSTPEPDHPDQVWVEYNIPKLCNVEMIKALPGLAGYSENGARGGFFVPRTELGEKIANFIGQVPADEDMFKPGGSFYSNSEG